MGLTSCDWVGILLAYQYRYRRNIQPQIRANRGAAPFPEWAKAVWISRQEFISDLVLFQTGYLRLLVCWSVARRNCTMIEQEWGDGQESKVIEGGVGEAYQITSWRSQPVGFVCERSLVGCGFSGSRYSLTYGFGSSF